MREVHLERTIQAPVADVFDWLTDATNFQRSPWCDGSPWCDPEMSPNTASVRSGWW